MDRKDLVEEINKNYPIKLSKMEKIIDNISNKYPYLEKTQIAFIVKSTFENIRKFLILGDTIKIQNFMNFTKLKITKNSIKIKISTPK